MKRVNWISFVGVVASSIIAGQVLMVVTGWNHWLCILLGSLTGLLWAPVFPRTE